MQNLDRIAAAGSWRATATARGSARPDIQPDQDPVSIDLSEIAFTSPIGVPPDTL
jgi:hypothetical protein